MKVLLVEDDVASMSYLEILMKREGHEYQKATDGKSGLKCFHEFNPDIVLSDINMAHMDGLEMVERIRQNKPGVIIIMLTAYNSEEYVIKAMKVGANNYLKKPVSKDNLISLLRKYTSIIKAKQIKSSICQFQKEHSFLLKFKTNTEAISSLVNFLVKESSDLFTEEQKLDIKLGLGELVLNSVEHGNMGITYEEKSQAVIDDTLQSLYAQKMSIPAIKNKEIAIFYRQTEEGAEWEISDEGTGFNPECIPNPISEDGIMRLHGRGIFICKFQFDEMEYIGKGNKVRVKKKFNSKN